MDVNNNKVKIAADISQTSEYQNLLGKISATYSQGKFRAHQAVNTHLIETYWQIGQYIVEFEQGGNIKAEYGKALLANLAKDLTLLHGKGFSRSNLVYMRLFYLRYPISQMPSHQLSWSHYVELLKLDNDLERGFYEKQAIAERWSVAELKINDVQHHDIGQMNLYMGYFANEENTEGDNPPIGIVLTKNKDELLVEYATYQMNSQLFVQKYQLYLPNEEELRRELEMICQTEEDNE
jgi:predicted nuclease of restriction endonuclease-like (RecB) superfamily